VRTRGLPNPHEGAIHAPKKRLCPPFKFKIQAATCNLSARLRRTDETLRYLEEALREHSARIIFLQVEPVFDFLHADERYRA
jgi:hypothetical protein